MALSREAIVISYRPLNADQCLYILEAIAEGVVQANMVEITTGIPDFQGLRAEGIAYENPVIDPRHGQHIGTISEVMHKERATCLEAASAAAAVIRIAGGDANVILVPQTDSYDVPIPWKFHAVVELPDGSFIDPTTEIQEGHAVVGACCGGCAVGNACESDCDDHDHNHPETGHPSSVADVPEHCHEPPGREVAPCNDTPETGACTRGRVGGGMTVTQVT